MFRDYINNSLKFITSKNFSQLSLIKNFSDIRCINEVRQEKSFFPISFALHSVGTVPRKHVSDKVKVWKKEVKDSLLLHGTEKYSFNYFVNKTKLPNDLDDTALCLSALKKSLPKTRLNPKYFLKIVNQESAPAGPYHTWFEHEKNSWQDIDIFVNANLVYFLSLNDIRVKKTEEFIESKILRRDVFSKYYFNTLFLYYFYSRFLSTLKVMDYRKKQVIKFIIKDIESIKKDSLENMILSNLTLLWLDQDLDKKCIENVTKFSKPNGSYPLIPICYDYKFKNQEVFAGSEIITTSLVIEMLSLYSSKYDKRDLVNLKDRSKDNFIKEQQHTKITDLISRSKLKTDLKRVYSLLDLNLLSLDSPAKISQSINRELNQNQLDFLINVSVSLHFFWTAYSYYDDIIDNQKNSTLLPVVNELMNIGWHNLIVTTSIDTKFYDELCSAFTTSHTAYKKEVSKRNVSVKELPDKLEVYYVIIKHILNHLKVPSTKFIITILKNIYILKQLNDDMHDVIEDRKTNRKTFVTQFLSEFVDEEKDEYILFWEKVFPQIHNICEKHYEQNVNLINKLKIDKRYLLILSQKAIKPIRDAKKQREEIFKLLKYYKHEKKSINNRR